MKYLMLMWTNTDAAGGNKEDIKAWADFEKDAKEVLVTGAALQPAKQASKLVRPRLAKPSKGEAIKKGTFNKGEKQIEAFYILNCNNEDEALTWARKLPTRATVEVRAFLEYDLN